MRQSVRERLLEEVMKLPDFGERGKAEAAIEEWKSSLDGTEEIDMERESEEMPNIFFHLAVQSIGSVKEVKLSELRPVGNFDTILERLEEKLEKLIATCHQKGKADGLGKFISLVVGELGIIDALQEGIRKGDVWDIEEAKQCLLFAHLLVMRANDVAQLYLNDIEMESPATQLNEYIASSEADIFRGWVIKD